MTDSAGRPLKQPAIVPIDRTTKRSASGFAVARGWLLHTRLDWRELEWNANGVTIRGQFYPLRTIKRLPNTPYLRPPPSLVLPTYDVRLDKVVESGRVDSDDLKL